MSQYKRLLKDQRGQTTFFVALSAMVLICFLAFMVDVGQLVHDRILVQSAADMTALSGANVQAAGLNEIADLNIEAENLVRDFRSDVMRVWCDRGQAIKCWKYYYSWVKHLHEQQNKANKDFATGAWDVAGDACFWFEQHYGTGGGPADPNGYPSRAPFKFASINASTYPNDELTVIGVPPYEYFQYPFWWVQGAPDSPIIPCYIWLGGDGKPQGYGRHRYMLISKMGVTVPDMTPQIPRKMIKDPNITTYFRVKVWRQAVKPFVNLKDFGFDVHIPYLEAYSLAQPTYGHIENKQVRYKARFMPLRSKYVNDMSFPHRDRMRH